MKRFDWKVKFQNPIFIAQLVLAILAPILSYVGMSYEAITSWAILGDLLSGALQNPYCLGLVVISVWYVITNPNTPGVTDTPKQVKKPTDFE